ncbi:MAG TPA: mercury methylation ferredoxin HgcB [Candidatus Wallbacteria bacterium]|nr:mercury methylation ferredoxin HgcB [Candidatus Wallbacteria bacterium]
MKLKHLENVSTVKLDSNKCTGCGICIEVCPHSVFSTNEKKAKIEDRDSCMECGACAKNCPAAAVSVKKGVGCAIAVINGIMNGTEPDCDCSGGASSCCG